MQCDARQRGVEAELNRREDDVKRREDVVVAREASLGTHAARNGCAAEVVEPCLRLLDVFRSDVLDTIVHNC